jgi:predicted membrane channel-forming protein YqfA (hemolysin III family)
MLLATSFCMACSATCHLCFVRSEHICDMVAKLDYWGIAVCCLGSSYPQISYRYACGNLVKLRWIFVSIITFLTATCMVLTLRPNVVASPLLRCIIFGTFAISVFGPIIYAQQDHSGFAMPETYEHLAIVSSLHIVGMFFFLSKVPERWFNKGYFDYFGHGHNIFHTIVVIAVGVDFYYSYKLYQDRQ